jgi:ABC-type multidrug transport system fused ATPase/permease subunit
MTPVELYALLLSRRLIDEGFVPREWTVVRSLLLTLFVLFVFRSVLIYATALFSAKFQLRINRNFQGRLFAHLLRLPMRVLARNPVGRMMSRVLDDGTRLAAVYEQLFGSLVVEPVKLAAFTLLLIALSWELFGILLISTIVSAGVMHWVGNRLGRISKEIQRKDSAMFCFVEEMFSNVELVKSKSSEERSAGEFRRILDQFIMLSLRMHRLTLLSRPVLQLLKFSSLGAVLFSGSWMVADGHISLGTLTMFLGTSLLFFSILTGIANTYGRLRENLARLEAVYELLDTVPEPISSFRSTPSAVPIQSIEYRNVEFHYPDSPPVLKGVSLRIEPGALVGIVGQSGSGKSTLIRLLLRFYEPEAGTVLVNGQSIDRIDPASLRVSIGVVLQENLMLNDTVRNNITFGFPSVAERQFLDAAVLSGVHDLIRNLSDGYDTEVGEQGRRLSGGQRQRLAIARAILTMPPVLVLDEATSYLEMDQEAEILRRIKEKRKDRITILITHRPSAVRFADRVVMLDNGRLVSPAVPPIYETAQYAG